MNENVMILSEADTVAVALTDWPADEIHAGLTGTDEVKRGHKIARTATKASAPVVKYSQMAVLR